MTEKEVRKAILETEEELSRETEVTKMLSLIDALEFYEYKLESFRKRKFRIF